jgi:hypothetical protein
MHRRDWWNIPASSAVLVMLCRERERKRPKDKDTEKTTARFSLPKRECSSQEKRKSEI